MYSNSPTARKNSEKNQEVIPQNPVWGRGRKSMGKFVLFSENVPTLSYGFGNAEFKYFYPLVILPDPCFRGEVGGGRSCMFLWLCLIIMIINTNNNLVWWHCHRDAPYEMLYILSTHKSEPCHLNKPTTLHYITLHYITLHYITLHYITLHYITLHYITLHYITFHYISLHFITLHLKWPVVHQHA